MITKLYVSGIDFFSRKSGLTKERVSRIARYLFVGGSLNLTLLIVVFAMVMIGFSYDLALFFTNIFGLIINYFLNRTFVFGSSGHVLRTMALYALTYATVYLFQLVLYRIIFATGLIHEYIAIVFTIGISAVYAYFVLEKIVFPDTRK